MSPNRRTRALVSLLLPLFALANMSPCFAVDAKASAKTSVDCWVLHQSSNFLGNVKMTIGGTATSLYLEKLGIESFADDKMTEVLILNHRDKTFLQEPRSQWKKRAEKYKAKSKQSASNFKGFKMSKGVKAKVAGTDCMFFEVKAIKKDGTLEPQEMRKQIWVSDTLVPGKGVAKQFVLEILRVFAQLDELPSTMGVLMRVKADKGRKLVTMLDTYKVEKSKTSIEMKVPKGYHRVKDEVSLLWGDDSGSDMFGGP